MKISFFLVLTVMLVSCGKGENADGIHLIDSKMIFGRSKPTKLSDIAESVEYIRLETRDDALIGMYPQVKIIDSLVVVYSHESGLFVFDSTTGRFKYKIPGFRDRGPYGYSGSNGPMVLDENGRIILHTWDRLGVWDYSTGGMSDKTIPLNPYKYSPMFFVNDTLLVGNVMNIDRNTKSTLNVVSYSDGSTVREYGFMEQTDANPNMTSMVRVSMCEYGSYINYAHFVHDFIYGIDKETLEIKPRYALDLGSRLKRNVVPMAGDAPEAFVAVSAMCETNEYLFLQFTESLGETVYLVYYDKAARVTHYVDSFNFRTSSPHLHGFVDDLGVGISFFPLFATTDGHVYSVMQAVDFVAAVSEARAAEMNVSESDNPVIVVAKLRK